MHRLILTAAALMFSAGALHAQTAQRAPAACAAVCSMSITEVNHRPNHVQRHGPPRHARPNRAQRPQHARPRHHSRPRQIAPPRYVAPRHYRTVRPGHSARGWRVWQPPRYTQRLRPAPRGMHYRLVDNNVVLVDNTTLQVMAIMGLLSALLR